MSRSSTSATRASHHHQSLLLCKPARTWKLHRRSCNRTRTWNSQTAFLNATVQIRGTRSAGWSWIIPSLQAHGYGILVLSSDEQKIVNALTLEARKFFAQPVKHKLAFKFFPIPGGYLTPYPGNHELFELRRGLASCPPELALAMTTFSFFESVALAVCSAIEASCGVKLSGMPSNDSPTLRCIHYDEPHRSLADRDQANAPVSPVPAKTPVRIVGLVGADAIFNGAKGVIASEACRDGLQTVRICQPPRVGHELSLPHANLRVIEENSPGMYPAHADSSLVTVAPRSSIAGLEAKDLQTGEWFSVEARLQPNECIIFVGDPLDYATAHRYPALMHRPAVPPNVRGSPSRMSTPFFLYPAKSAVLSPADLPSLTFDELNNNHNGCRDRFPWKLRTHYYEDMVYS